MGPNLEIMFSTTIRESIRDNITGRVDGLMLVTRSDISTSPTWSRRLSDELEDWYSPQPSAVFNKSSMVVRAKIVIEATEFGDVLVSC